MYRRMKKGIVVTGIMIQVMTMLMYSFSEIKVSGIFCLAVWVLSAALLYFEANVV